MEKITLLTSYFVPMDEHRKREIAICMQNNIKNKQIDHIVNIGTKYDHPRVKNLYNIGRPTFKDFIDEIEKIESDYYIIANADIFFCSKLSRIKEIDMTNRVLCLTRWDLTAQGEAVHYNYDLSQDVWIFKGKPPKISNIDFEIGRPACDGRFAFELKQAGLEPVNPSLDIYCYHVHRSKYRDYDPVNDRIEGETFPVPIENYTKYKINN